MSIEGELHVLSLSLRDLDVEAPRTCFGDRLSCESIARRAFLSKNFSPFPVLSYRTCLLSTMLACSLSVLPLTASLIALQMHGECSATCEAFFRGLCSGLVASLLVSPCLMFGSSISICGEFLACFFWTIPISIVPSLGLALVPTGGPETRMGIAVLAISGGVVAFAISYALIVLPNATTKEHRALEMSIGPVSVAVVMFFFLMNAGYASLVKQMPSSPFPGLLLPVITGSGEVLYLWIMRRAFLRNYVFPKAEFIAAEEGDRSGELPLAVVPTPPIIGFQESNFAQGLALASLIFENTKFVAVILEVSENPHSRTWMVSLIASSIAEVSRRSGVFTRVGAWGFRNNSRIREAMALDMFNILYLEAQQGCGFVAPCCALCIGCARAIMFKDWRAVLWMDIHPSLAVLFLAVFLCEFLQDSVVWGLGKALDANLRRRDLPSVGYPTIRGQIHPLADMSKIEGAAVPAYILIFSVGTACSFLMLLIFLGEDFMFAGCKDPPRSSLPFPQGNLSPARKRRIHSSAETIPR